MPAVALGDRLILHQFFPSSIAQMAQLSVTGQPVVWRLGREGVSERKPSLQIVVSTSVRVGELLMGKLLIANC